MRNLQLHLAMPKNISPRKESLLWAGAAVAVLCFFLIIFGDKPAALFFHAAVPGLALVRQAAREITVLGNSALYLVPCLVFYLALRFARPGINDQGKREKITRLAGLCLFLFSAVAFSGLLTDLLKAFLGRPRPRLLFHQGLYSFSFFQSSARMWSFPSGHANTIFALATACFLVAPRWRFIYFSVAVMVAGSRVVIGDHYPSDVLMGSYLGILTTIYLKEFFQNRGIDVFQADRQGSALRQMGPG